MAEFPYKPVGVFCFIVCAIAFFKAWERYQDESRLQLAMTCQTSCLDLKVSKIPIAEFVPCVE